MICDQPYVIERLNLGRDLNMECMNKAEYSHDFYFHMGKLYAFNEMLEFLRTLDDD